MIRRKTAGELTLKASADTTRYDPLEVGEALCNDIIVEVWKCIDAHYDKIDEPEFCVCILIGGDPLIRGIKRRKFYAWPYLPSPRPNQICFHYNKRTDDIVRLWSLPNAQVMAVISETQNVSNKWVKTKGWCDAFFGKDFFDYIRKESGLSLQSEREYLNAHREELIKAGCQEVDTLPPEPFDFSKITIDKIIDTKAAAL